MVIKAAKVKKLLLLPGGKGQNDPELCGGP